MAWISQVVLVIEKTPTNVGDMWDMGSIPVLGRCPGGVHGNPLQYSCLEDPMSRGAWWATVHRVTKSQTWLTCLSMHFGALHACWWVTCITSIFIIIFWDRSCYMHFIDGTERQRSQGPTTSKCQRNSVPFNTHTPKDFKALALFW